MYVHASVHQNDVVLWYATNDHHKYQPHYIPLTKHRAINKCHSLAEEGEGLGTKLDTYYKKLLAHNIHVHADDS